MPYDASSASANVTVLGVSVELRADKSVARAGEYVRFSGKVYLDSTGYGNTRVYIQHYDESTGTWRDIVYADTDEWGNFYASIKMGYEWACKKKQFRARHTSGAVSNTVTVAVAFPTRISISAPSTAVPGQVIQVTGKLEYESSPGVWKPLVNKPVYIYLEGDFVMGVYTDSDGNYSANVTMPMQTGTYTVSAEFLGEGIQAVGLAFAPATAGLTTISEEIKTFVEENKALIGGLLLVGGAALVYSVVRKRLRR